jgi:hypothetical protein
MTKQRVLAPAILLLAGAVAACGGTTASPVASGAASPDTASPAASDVASPSAAPSDAASPDAGTSGSPAASGGASPDASASASASADTSGGGGDLASTLPTTVGDLAMSTTTVDPQTFIATNVNLQLTPILTALDRTAADLEVVVANGTGPTGSLFINAVRIPDADLTPAVTAFQTAAAAAPGNQVETGQVGGKDVVTVTTGSYTMGVYVTADTMYFVQSPDPALVEAGLAAIS